MNTSPESSIELPKTETLNGFAYGIIISIGILVFIASTILLPYLCTRILNDSTPQQQQQVTAPPPDIESGLDEATLTSYPKLLYSETKTDQRKKGSPTSCSICLADYEDRDELRLLPDCVHVFHTKCVDPWLRLHTSCPLCRTSLLLTPVTTPPAEGLPLARQQGC